MGLKRLLRIVVCALFLIPFSSLALPGFMIIDGNIKTDNRDAPIGTLVQFKTFIYHEEVGNYTANTPGKYGPIVINMDTELTGTAIEVYVDGILTNEEFSYSTPDYFNLNISANTNKGLKITDYYPEEFILSINESNNVIFDVDALNGYEDPVYYKWYLDGVFSSNEETYNFSTNYGENGQYNVTVLVNDGYTSDSLEWNVNVLEVDDDAEFTIDCADPIADSQFGVPRFLVRNFVGLGGDKGQLT